MQYVLVKNATCTITAAVVHVAQSVLRIRKGAYFNCANSEKVLANMHIAQSVPRIRKGAYFNRANSEKVLANMHIAQSETSRKGEKQYMGPQPTIYHGRRLAVF